MVFHMSIHFLSLWLPFALCFAKCGSAATVPAPDQGVSAPPNLPVSFVRPAVDHAVTYAFWRGFGPKNGDRIKLTRHQNLVRETTKYLASKRDFEQASVTSYSNLTTNASVRGDFRGPREISGFTFWRRDKSDRGQFRYHLVKTDELRSIAGERCTMWRAEPIRRSRGEGTGVPRRACITSDGLVLYDAWFYSSGGVGEERTALTVERREVTPAEVLPPREALNFRSWTERAVARQAVPTGRPRNFELRMKQESSWKEPDRARFRGSNGWELWEEWSKGKLQRFRFYHSSSTLRAHASPDQLEIYFQPAPKVASWDSSTEPLDRKAERMVLGEECRWFNTTVNVSDYSRHECRAEDGLPLIVEEGGQGDDWSTLVAVFASRGKTDVNALMPPSSIMSWEAWGWPDLERPQRGADRSRRR